MRLLQKKILKIGNYESYHIEKDMIVFFILKNFFHASGFDAPFSGGYLRVWCPPHQYSTDSPVALGHRSTLYIVRSGRRIKPLSFLFFLSSCSLSVCGGVGWMESLPLYNYAVVCRCFPGVFAYICA